MAYDLPILTPIPGSRSYIGEGEPPIEIPFQYNGEAVTPEEGDTWTDYTSDMLDTYIYTGIQWQWMTQLKGQKGDMGLDGKSAYQIAVEKGFSGTASEWLASLKGQKGDSGNTGSPGENAQPPQLQLGSVTTLSAGESAYATIAESSPNSYTIDLFIPRGANGSNGASGANGQDAPSPTISVGQVSTLNAGQQASASITGSSPNFTLNLAIPQGDRGATGSSNSLSIGSITTGSPGSEGSISITGIAPNQVLNFVIPRGQDGVSPSPNSLSIGSVTTGASASATITGSSPSQTLNLVLPKGDKGDKGDTGSQGSAATIQLGSVTTGAAGSSVSVTNSGTSSAAVLNFTIPRGDQGTAGANATTTATATNSSNGLMSSADKTKLDGLSNAKLSAGSAAIVGALIAGGSVDITVPLSVTMPNTTYQAVCNITGAAAISVLGTLSIAIKTKNTTNVVVTAKNTGLVLIAAGTVIEVIAISP